MTTNDPTRGRAAAPPFRGALLALALALAAGPALAAPPPAALAVAASMTPEPALPAQAQTQAPSPAPMQGLLQRAMALLGTPYRWGGTSPDRGFDCSGLVGYVYRTALGIDLPRVSRDQARAGELVDRATMAVGDLVFFGRRGRVDHVGIYVGEGKFVHAPSRGKDVTVSSLDGGYWGGRFMQARRIAQQ